MTVPRKTPYVCATWITKFLAQENYCKWAAWFQAHYQNYEKAPSDFPDHRVGYPWATQSASESLHAPFLRW